MPARPPRALVLAILAGASACGPCFSTGSRSVEAECRANLKALYTSERAYCQEKDLYSPRIAEIGFSPERGNRYAYFLASTGVLEDRSTTKLPSSCADCEGVGADTLLRGPAAAVRFADLPELMVGRTRVGIHGKCPDCEFVAACAGNIDSDPVLDVWSIASFPREAPDGTRVEAGQPYHEVVDRDPKPWWQP